MAAAGVGSKRAKLQEVNANDDVARSQQIRRQKRGQQELRTAYQALLATVKDHVDDDRMGLGKCNWEEALQKADELVVDASRPREQLQDADVLESLAFSLSMQVKALQQHEGRSPADFVAGLCRHFGRPDVVQASRAGEGEGEEEAASEQCMDWARMGREHAVHLLRPAATFGTMLGPMGAEAPRGRAMPQRRRREEALGATVTPDEADADAAQDNQERERETQARVTSLYRRIKKGRPGSGVPVLPLLVDPESFTRSVENVFALSFLIKDGKCQLSALPPQAGRSRIESIVAECKEAPTDEERAGGRLECTQFVLRLDYADWHKLKDNMECFSQP